MQRRADKAEPGAAGEPGVCQPSSQLVIHSFSVLGRRQRGGVEAAVICLAQESGVLSGHSKLAVTSDTLLTLNRPSARKNRAPIERPWSFPRVLCSTLHSPPHFAAFLPVPQSSCRSHL